MTIFSKIAYSTIATVLIGFNGYYLYNIVYLGIELEAANSRISNNYDDLEIYSPQENLIYDSLYYQIVDKIHAESLGHVEINYTSSYPKNYGFFALVYDSTTFKSHMDVEWFADYLNSLIVNRLGHKSQIQVIDKAYIFKVIDPRAEVDSSTMLVARGLPKDYPYNNLMLLYFDEDIGEFVLKLGSSISSQLNRTIILDNCSQGLIGCNLTRQNLFEIEDFVSDVVLNEDLTKGSDKLIRIKNDLKNKFRLVRKPE